MHARVCVCGRGGTEGRGGDAFVCVHACVGPECVPLLEAMDRYERSRVADALVDSVFASGEVVIREGDTGNRFYLVRPQVLGS